MLSSPAGASQRTERAGLRYPLPPRVPEAARGGGEAGTRPSLPKSSRARRSKGRQGEAAIAPRCDESCAASNLRLHAPDGRDRSREVPTVSCRPDLSEGEPQRIGLRWVVSRLTRVRSALRSDRPKQLGLNLLRCRRTEAHKASDAFMPVLSYLDLQAFAARGRGPVPATARVVVHLPGFRRRRHRSYLARSPRFSEPPSASSNSNWTSSRTQAGLKKSRL